MLKTALQFVYCIMKEGWGKEFINFDCIHFRELKLNEEDPGIVYYNCLFSK